MRPLLLLASAALLLASNPARADEWAELAPSSIGPVPVARAAAPAAALQTEVGPSGWRVALASGVVGRSGGERITARERNAPVLVYLGLQADAEWPEGRGQAARLRLELMAGGENTILAPSDGALEAAFMLGPREFRFVVGRLELQRYPSLGLETLAQVSTLPSVEGSLSFAGDAVRFDYLVAPVQMGWVYYYGGAHIDHGPAVATESDRPFAASAGRLRYTLLLPSDVVLSVQGELMKAWKEPDLLAAGEAGLGYAVLARSVAFHLGARWTSYERRGPATADDTDRASDLKVMLTATLGL